MKLWLLEVRSIASVSPWDSPYDKAFGFVVRAATEMCARTFAACNAGDENPKYRTDEDSPWYDVRLTSCEELTNEGAIGVVVRDFNAG